MKNTEVTGYFKVEKGRSTGDIVMYMKLLSDGNYIVVDVTRDWIKKQKTAGSLPHCVTKSTKEIFEQQFYIVMNRLTLEYKLPK